MSEARLPLCFGVHNHQPVGNFEHVLADATERAYRPFLERVHARPEVRLTVHSSGGLLEWWREHAPRVFDLLGAVVARGQVELLTGGFYEPILPVLPECDAIGQIERLSDFLKTHFGVRPRGMWLAERVWEPHLPRVLCRAGVEYVLVDDSHFELAGVDAASAGGYYLTEEQGVVLGVFPISQRLRYLMPWAPVEESLAYLAERRGRVPALTAVDDGEKFGGWPGTWELVYERGWLDRFFDGILDASWIEMATFADVVDRVSASGRIYLPTASYREMGEWVLSPDAAGTLREAKRHLSALEGGTRLASFLHGGFWRGFLLKYPEVADTYWKMLRLSRAIEGLRERRPDDPRLAAARVALWRGQANDAYWHGVFGGCYLPHLRRAVKQALIEAERLVADVADGPAVSWFRGDANGDGREEVLVRTRELAVTLNPDLGGAITELASLPRALDLADVLARRPESYHVEIGAREAVGAPAVGGAPGEKQAGLGTLLAYDRFRRASLLDALLDSSTPVDPRDPWAGARLALGARRFTSAVEELPDGVAVLLTLDGRPASPLHVEKRVVVRGATVSVRYRVGTAVGAPISGRWLCQWNLALTAGDAPGRYLALPDRPSLGSSGRMQGMDGVSLVDEWVGVEARLAWSPRAEVAWSPVETVSVSEGGFERIYQGLALSLVWPLEPEGSGEWEMRAELTVVGR
ncbi:MAG: DUF1926 domain-containing protein [Candidatus Rokubacteria bacterium]|nr:DUF1926 domain-containing protein [Candidatus Rokubacteria bacterium]